VMLDLCLGDHVAATEVNLVDRSNYKYPLLIGRMFLSDRFMVDSSSTHLVTSHCPPRSAK
jgi:hypothetical protein